MDTYRSIKQGLISTALLLATPAFALAHTGEEYTESSGCLGSEMGNWLMHGFGGGMMGFGWIWMLFLFSIPFVLLVVGIAVVIVLVRGGKNAQDTLNQQDKKE